MHQRFVTVLDEYGGYYYVARGDGRFAVRMPGSEAFIITLPNIELLHRFVDDCNKLFAEHTKGLRLHIGGCKRCERSVSGGVFNPCATGAPLLFKGKIAAQELTELVANNYKTWLNSDSGDGLQTDGRSVTKDTAKVSNV